MQLLKSILFNYNDLRPADSQIYRKLVKCRRKTDGWMDRQTLESRDAKMHLKMINYVPSLFDAP